MPHFGALGQANLLQLGTFLNDSRGGQAAPKEQPALKGNATAGKQVFATAGCTGCHTLKDAGSSGTVGPNLDQMKPADSLVVSFVTNGSPSGKMPSFKGTLSAQQIADVAAYVSSVAGK